MHSKGKMILAQLARIKAKASELNDMATGLEVLLRVEGPAGPPRGRNHPQKKPVDYEGLHKMMERRKNRFAKQG